MDNRTAVAIQIHKEALRMYNTSLDFSMKECVTASMAAMRDIFNREVPSSGFTPRHVPNPEAPAFEEVRND